jgi:hypothetical protein
MRLSGPINSSMEVTMKNISGHHRRKPSDNLVEQSGGAVKYLGYVIEYDMSSSSWLLSGKHVGSISNLSKRLGLNVETHDIGMFLERHGYVFRTPFG